MTGRHERLRTGDYNYRPRDGRYSQGPDFTTVKQLVRPRGVRTKSIPLRRTGPALMDTRGHWPIQPMSRHSVAPWPLTSQIQPF